MQCFVSDVKLRFPLLNTTLNVTVDENQTTSPKKSSRRSTSRKSRSDVQRAPSPGKVVDEAAVTTTSEQTEPEKKASEEPETAQTTDSAPILMVEVVNVTHDKFRQTEEIKVQ